MVDIDDDGDSDLLVGDASGFVTLYLRDYEGNLNSAGHLEADGEEISVFRAAPHTVDWDLDGDFDLLVGMFGGNISFFRNSGSPEEFEFTLEGLLSADGDEIYLGGDTAPAFADLDNDGKRDLIAGCTWGEIWFYPNTGEDDDPEFGAGAPLSDENDVILLEGYTRVEVIDWDNDGDLDILTGLLNPELRLFINPTENDVSNQTDFPVSDFRILSNYPEPFNNSTRILFQTSRPGLTQLQVLELSGRLVWSSSVELNNNLPQSCIVDLSGQSSGRYIFSLSSNGSLAVRMITLVR